MLFYLQHLLESRPIFSGFANAQESLCCTGSPAACYKRLYVFQVIDPSGIMKYIAFWNARGAAYAVRVVCMDTDDII